VLVGAAVHAALAALAALVGAALLIAGHSLAVWPLLLAGLAGASGGLVYLIVQFEGVQPLAGGVLLAAQLGTLGWALLLVGPRTALLMLVPGLTLPALRYAGRIAAGLFVCAALVLYGAYAMLALQFGLLPAVQLDTLGLTLLDGACICA